MSTAISEQPSINLRLKKALSDWNVFQLLVAHGSQEEKQKLGLPENFSITSTGTAELSELHRAVKGEHKAFLESKREELNKARSQHDLSIPAVRREIARELRADAITLMDRMKLLGVDASLTMHTMHPQDWDDQLTFCNSQVASKVEKRESLGRTFFRGCRDAYETGVNPPRSQGRRINIERKNATAEMLKLYSHATGQRIRRFPWQVFDTRLAEGRYRTSSEPKLELSGFDFGEKVRRPDLLTEREKRRFHASLIQRKIRIKKL